MGVGGVVCVCVQLWEVLARHGVGQGRSMLASHAWRMPSMPGCSSVPASAQHRASWHGCRHASPPNRPAPVLVWVAQRPLHVADAIHLRIPAEVPAGRGSVGQGRSAASWPEQRPKQKDSKACSPHRKPSGRIATRGGHLAARHREADAVQRRERLPAPERWSLPAHVWPKTWASGRSARTRASSASLPEALARFG